MNDGIAKPGRGLRHAFGKFPTGVTVVTTVDANGEPRGFTANSFASVSLDPPLLLVCIAKTALSVDVFTRADGFAVNVLSEHQRDTSGLFASKSAGKFSGTTWVEGPAGHPLLGDVSAWFDCITHRRVDAGDHYVLIGEVKGFDVSSRNPLGYLQGGYFTPGISSEAIDALVKAGRTRIGAIVEHQRSILFLDDTSTGKIRLPMGECFGSADLGNSLMGELRRLQVDASIEYLYSVFEQQATGEQFIYYRGHAASERTKSGGFVPFDRVEWEALPDAAVRSMLRRYIEEHDMDAFGLYVGSYERGDVRPLT